MFSESNKKFVLQGHNVQIMCKKYRKEIGQKVSIKKHNGVIVNKIRNQIGKAIDDVRSRTNIRTLTSSKFHQRSRTTESDLNRLVQ